MKITLDDIRELVPHADYDTYVALVCPMHESVPVRESLLAYAPRTKGEKGYFHCQSCGKHGNLEQLYNALQGWVPPGGLGNQHTRYDAPKLPTDIVELEELVIKAHLVLEKHGSQLAWYLEDRGVDWCIGPCELGWFDGWITMPIRDAKQNLEGVMLRASPMVQGTSNIRFHQPKGQKPLFYIPDRALVERTPRLAVVYGMFDALALATLRLPVVTTTGGKDSFNPDWLSPFRKPVVVIPDYGEDDTARKLAGKLGWRGSVCMLPYTDDIHDPADFLKHGKGSELVKILDPLLKG